jgi:hypothetical protein
MYGDHGLVAILADAEKAGWRCLKKNHSIVKILIDKKSSLD